MRDDVTVQETEIEAVERLAARGLVIAGGAFWAIAAFAGPYVYHGIGFAESIKTAAWPFLAALVILVIGWSYERLAALLLFAAAAGVVVWGSMYAWEVGVWVIMTFVLILPMVSAGVLFLLSERAQFLRSAQAAAQRSVRVDPSGARPATGPHPRTR